MATRIMVNLNMSNLEPYLKECLEYCNSSGHTKQKSLVLAFLPVLICGKFELAIRDIIVRWAHTYNIPYLANFIKKSIGGNSWPLKNLKIFVENLDPKLQPKFIKNLGPHNIETYDRLFSARNHTAHGTDADIKEHEIMKFYKTAIEVAHTLEETLYDARSGNSEQATKPNSLANRSGKIPYS